MEKDIKYVERTNMNRKLVTMRDPRLERHDLIVNTLSNEQITPPQEEALILELGELVHDLSKHPPEEVQ